jgi:hypothetical protein
MARSPAATMRRQVSRHPLTPLTLWRKVIRILAHMKTTWFKRFGWFYVPTSVPGALVVLLAALFCLTVFRAVDRHSHSVSDTLYGVFPFFVCTFLLLDWVGGRTSDRGA